MVGSRRSVRSPPGERRRGDDDGRGHEIWGYVPVTVMAVVSFSAAFTMLGIRPLTVTGDGGFFLFDLQDLLQVHVFSLFMHLGPEHWSTTCSTCCC